MTPFDPAALLAMLLTFYPVVGPAAFERARRERPEYFAGGQIIGTGRDKLQLPDSRIFDFIFDVGGPASRWIALEILPGDGSGGPADPFALEDGPLRTIDESAWPPPAPAPFFEPLVVSALGELGDAGGALDRSHGTITEAAAAGDLDATLGGALGDGAGALDNSLGAAGEFVPDDVAANSGGQSSNTTANEGLYGEPTPLDFPQQPAPLSGGDSGGGDGNFYNTN